LGEADAEIVDAEAILRWVDALELFDIASACIGHTLNGGGHTQAGGAVQAAQVGLGPGPRG